MRTTGHWKGRSAGSWAPHGPCCPAPQLPVTARGRPTTAPSLPAPGCRFHVPTSTCHVLADPDARPSAGMRVYYLISRRTEVPSPSRFSEDQLRRLAAPDREGALCLDARARGCVLCHHTALWAPERTREMKGAGAACPDVNGDAFPQACGSGARGHLQTTPFLPGAWKTSSGRPDVQMPLLRFMEVGMRFMEVGTFSLLLAPHLRAFPVSGWPGPGGWTDGQV